MDERRWTLSLALGTVWALIGMAFYGQGPFWAISAIIGTAEASGVPAE